MSTQLLDVLNSIRSAHPDLQIADMKDFHVDATDEGATLEFKNGLTVQVTLLERVAHDDALRQGMLAHSRVARSANGAVKMLVIMPGLAIADPILLTTRVLITNLDPELIAAGLRYVVPL
jgi:hypothetical protein